MTTTLYLVSCVGQKTAEPAPARDLYVSMWFRKARAFVERELGMGGARWFILSAKLGLLHPEAVVSPYEQTLNTMTAAERRAWGAETAAAILRQLNGVTRVVFLAGTNYREHVIPAIRAARPDVQIDVPMAGLGIGEQLHYLTEALHG